MIIQPIFKFTLYNTALYPAGVVINIPVGWKDAILKLERHKDFNSLVEFFESAFVWFGSARDYVREIEDDQGVDAKIRLTVEIYYQKSWDLIFDGQIDVSQFEDIAKANTFYKTKAPIIRDDFWSRLINRQETPIDVSGTLDIYGGTRIEISPITLPLPSQVIRVLSHYIEEIGSAFYETTIDEDDYIQVGFQGVVVDEAKKNLGIPTAVNPILPGWFWEPEYDGTFSFEMSISLSVFEWINLKIANDSPPYCVMPDNLYDSTENFVDFYFKINDEAPIPLNEDNSPLVVIKRGTRYYLTVNDIPLKKGDQVRVYGVNFDDSWGTTDVTHYQFASLILWGKDNSEVFTTSVVTGLTLDGPIGGGATCEPTREDIQFDHGAFPTDCEGSYFKVTGDTIFTDSETDAFLIKDAAESIISKITGFDNVIDSDYFETEGKNVALMRGLHVRGYSFDDKPLFMTFRDWWEGANPLLALGLGYIQGENKIEIEPISEFFDNVPVVNFSNVPDLVRTYDLEKHYKSIEVGFTKWSAESDSGIDDPQSKKIYNTRFSAFGQDEKILSKFYMASLGIERSRRNRIELGKDDRLDEDIMAIRLIEDSDGYSPELGILFDTTNLLNPDERYNVRDTPATIFKRWQDLIQGCLQKYPTDKFKFGSAEGNYDTTKEFPSDDWEFPSLDISELQDIDITTDFLFIPQIYKCSVPMDYGTYRTIRNNRKKAIGISRTETGHVPMFIMDLEYKIMAGNAELTLMNGTNVIV